MTSSPDWAGILTRFNWTCEHVEGGTMYWDTTAESLATGAAEIVRCIVNGEIDPYSLSKIKHGSCATVYEHGDNLAIKHFYRDGWSEAPKISGVPYLAASIALHEGLKIIQPQLPFWHRRRGLTKFQYNAPAMYGAFVPEKSELRHPVSIMSRERGEDLSNAAIKRPHEGVRTAVYRAALSSVGIPISKVSLDPTCTNTHLLELGHRLIRVTRLDIHAKNHLLSGSD